MNKKERIIQASIEVFKEKGIEKTKVSDIVSIAGVAQGTFYLYFPSKLSVMPAIAEVLVEKIIDTVHLHVQKEQHFSIQLEQLIDTIFQITHDYQEVLALIYAGLSASEHIKKWESVYEPFYLWMSNFLLDAQQKQLIRSSIDVHRTAKLMIALIESSAEQVYLYDVTQAEEAAIQKKEVFQFVSHALGMNE